MKWGVIFVLQMCKELIDTLWNVNVKAYKMSDNRYTELIDTLWNVNRIQKHGKGMKFLELIDTLWNVNENKDSYAFFSTAN